ncbi:MAG TPA: hypothetical protein VGQ71_07790 [Terriglobales bacterium]|jgi:hypothetical protein|nr:hypothetical protein [Terriglobales bacterium]
MKRISMFMITGILVALVANGAAQSLGEAARKPKKAPSAAKKVYTNDDLPTSGNISVLGPSAPAADAAGEKAAAGNSAEKKAAAEASKPLGEMSPEERTKAEEAWRARFAEQRKKIAQLERELEVAQREYRLKLSGYYFDAGNQLRDPKKWNEEDAKLRAEIAAKEKELAEAKDKLELMREELRQAGFPSSLAD